MYIMLKLATRYPEVCYTEEGEEFGGRLWEETMRELDFAGVRGIILGMKN